MNDPADLKAALRKAATIIQRLEQKIRALELARSEPIALVGIGCRLPGGVHDLESLWELMQRGTDAVEPIPSARFDGTRSYDFKDMLHGALVNGVESFDADFWGISRREAAWVDPQHRLLLECAWEALENSGIPADRLYGRRVGVYVGIGSGSDYAERVPFDEFEPADAFAARLGTSFSAGRISFALGLQGPAVAVETACSSSLVAFHLACRALRARECEIALVGGVQVIFSREPFIVLSQLGALASDGRCKSFSDRADGYGRGEGAAMVVLKRLTDALAAGDRVLAVVKGTAVNHDGPRSGLKTPNGTAQRDLMKQALVDASLAPADIDYVEAHAIGTSLGDAIEVEAIADVYGKDRGEPLRLGSVKTNLAHLEPASGVVGVLKAVACLRYEAIPPTLHTERLNPDIDWRSLPVRVVRELEAWPRGERPRRAGVSAFGLSGTNAHVVLEEGASSVPTSEQGAPVAELVFLSAKTPAALNAMADGLRRHLDAHPTLTLEDVAHSLATTRSAMPHRLTIVAGSQESLRGALALAANGGTPPASARGHAVERPGKLAWVFSGEGFDALEMGQRLHARWPVFRDAIEAAWEALEPQLGVPLRQAWSSPSAFVVQHSDLVPAAQFALQHALAALWRSWGIMPNLLLGQSIGELAAACFAGVFSVEDAARLVAQRCRLLRALGSGSTAHELDELDSVTRSVTYHPAAIEMVSSAGARREGIAHACAAYWYQQLQGEGHGAGEIATLLELGATTLMHIGGPASSLDLVHPSDEARRGLIVLQSLAPLRGEDEAILEALGQWVSEGGAVNWANVFPPSARRVELPTYPWQRERYWVAGASED
jgi:acyl transferase domain-containing protein